MIVCVTYYKIMKLTACIWKLSRLLLKQLFLEENFNIEKLLSSKGHLKRNRFKKIKGKWSNCFHSRYIRAEIISAILKIKKTKIYNKLIKNNYKNKVICNLRMTYQIKNHNKVLNHSTVKPMKTKFMSSWR